MIDENYIPAQDEPWKLEQLLPAEKIMLEKAKTGDEAKISDFKPASPETYPWTDEHKIRAKVIRHLLRHPTVYSLDPKGFDIFGARIAGPLNLENLKIEQRFGFFLCQFDATPVLRNARLRSLAFHACRLPGLRGDGLQVQGNLFLRHSVFTGEVRLLCAQVTGDVSCTGATFTHKGKKAFSADKIIVGSALYLDGVTVSGETRFLGAQVTGDVECSRATFANPGGDAFAAQRITVTGRLFWQDMGAQPDGWVDFTHARVGDFLDDEQSWPQTGKLILDGFVYDNITTNTSAAQRIRWLALMPKTLNGDEPVFWPQPYEQLIKVFKDAGHEREARLVGIAKKDAQLKYLQTKAHQASASSTRRIKWMKFTRATMRYGYEPWRVMYPIGAACLFGLFWFWGSYHFNYMVPSKEKVYLAPCYVGTEINCPNWVSHDRKIIGQIGA